MPSGVKIRLVQSAEIEGVSLILIIFELTALAPVRLGDGIRLPAWCCCEILLQVEGMGILWFFTNFTCIFSIFINLCQISSIDCFLHSLGCSAIFAGFIVFAAHWDPQFFCCWSGSSFIWMSQDIVNIFKGIEGLFWEGWINNIRYHWCVFLREQNHVWF